MRIETDRLYLRQFRYSDDADMLRSEWEKHYSVKGV